MTGSGLLQHALAGSALVVAIGPGKVGHRVWFSTGDAGLLEEPRSVPSLRPGLDEVTAAIRRLARGAGAGRGDRGHGWAAWFVGAGSGGAVSLVGAGVRAVGDRGCQGAAGVAAVQVR